MRPQRFLPVWVFPNKSTKKIITTNNAHRIRKARKSNHSRLLRHDLLFVPQSRIILSRIIEGFLNNVRSEITKTLPQFLYHLISPEYLHPDCFQIRLTQFKLPSSSYEGTIW